MSLQPSVTLDGDIRYVLTSRLSTEGRIAVSLQLFRRGDMAHSHPLGDVDRHQIADVMSKCRSHLNRLGVQQLSAPKAAPGRLPPARTLQVKL